MSTTTAPPRSDRPAAERPPRRRLTSAPRAALRRCWEKPRLGRAVAVVATAVLSAVAVWLMPRGPVTTAQAVGLLLGAGLVGVGAGAVMRSRWALVAAPLTFVAVWELAWLVVDGPMTDAPRFDSVMGVLVVVFGRGWLALVALLPMTVGAALGVAWARRRGPTPDVRPHRAGTVVTAVGAVAVLVLLGGLLRPASTPPILDADGRPLAGSIAELTTVELGGHEQGLLLRGVDASNPVLLYLAGGPGGTDLGAMRLFGSQLERDFVVASWDQRPTGTSYAALEPRETVTVEQAVDDVLELTDHLRERFDEERIYVVGNSWGTTLAVLAAQRSPERFAALVGTGQMVSQRHTDILMYEEMLADAAARGDTARVTQLQQLGPPPFDDIGAYAPLLVRSSDAAATEWPANVLVREYELVEQVTSLPALLETFATLYPQLQDIDFRRDVPRLDVPLYVVDGADEHPARAELTTEWLAELEAPLVRHLRLEDAGHRPHLEQPDAFAEVMGDVLADTAGS